MASNLSSSNVTSLTPPVLDDVTFVIPRSISNAGVVLGALIIAVGTFGNVLIILSVLSQKSLSKSSNMFVVSLAVWDLLQGLCVRPLYVHTYMVGEWEFGRSACMYALVASNLSILESITHVTVIALYRYVIIVHPVCARCFLRRRHMIVFLLFMHLLPLLLVLIPTLVRSHAHEQLVFNKRIMFCSFAKHREFRLSGVLKKVIFLGIIASLLLFCYVGIIQKVRQSRRSVNAQGRVFSSARIRKEMMLLKTVITMFFSFVLMYLPLSVVYGVDAARRFPYCVYFVGIVLLWTSSSANWIIYGCVNRQYTAAYAHMLCRQGRSSAAPSRAGSGRDCGRTLTDLRPGVAFGPSRPRRSGSLNGAAATAAAADATTERRAAFRNHFRYYSYSSISGSAGDETPLGAPGHLTSRASPPLRMSVTDSPFKCTSGCAASISGRRLRADWRSQRAALDSCDVIAS